MTAYIEARPAAQPLPRLSALLLVAAAVHLAALIISRELVNNGLALSARDVPLYVSEAMPFALASALVAGWARWPHAKAWLVAAAVAFAIAGALDAAGQLWVGWILSDPSRITFLGNGLEIQVLPAAASLAAPVGPLLLAIGLWRGASRPIQSQTRRRILAGVVLLVVGIWAVNVFLTFFELSLLANSYGGLAPGIGVLATVSSLSGGAFALTGLAAVRAAPRRYLVPEVLIAAGGLLFSLVLTVTGLATMPPYQFSGAWLGIAPPLELVGLAAVVLGFFSARISVPGET